MEISTKRQALLKAIHERLKESYEDTLEDVLELLDTRASEDIEDIKAMQESREDIKRNGSVSWEQVKQEIASE
ncbi:MAG: hypothetical protein WBF90_09455 [Rivularia sp. (in: cyanobacteria)]|jgi:hypothetical protein